MEEKINLSELKQAALHLGFDDVGVTQATIPDEDKAAYLSWLSKGYQGKLSYLENQVRCDPNEILPGAKSAIMFVSYYKQPKLPFKKDAGLIASYARGRDYHNVHRKRLKKFIHWLETKAGETGIAKGFSDSTPILEKALAVQSGLGWFGKNTLLIHRKFGTFTLLSGVLTTLSFPFSVTSLRLPRCGSCTRCLDACPTQAFIEPYRLDASRCLSNHLIESKEELSDDIHKKNPGYLFGCDVCQDVCPHNFRKIETDAKDFAPTRGMGPYLNLEDLKILEENPELLYGTPLQRRGVRGLQDNAKGAIKRDAAKGQ
ncbi:MAG: tRNA epoxyqueuosine(34) reductase QueG [Waddliaceae bacterium]